MVTGSVLVPGDVPAATMVWNVKVLPLPLKGCTGAPPIVVRSAATKTLVLVGLVPGVTVTLRSVVPPGKTEFGFAVPTPAGFVGVGVGVAVGVAVGVGVGVDVVDAIPLIEMLSIANACAFVTVVPLETE
jgi:hypothetical protein